MLPQIERMKTSRKVTKFLYGGATLQIKYNGIRDLGIKVPITLLICGFLTSFIHSFICSHKNHIYMAAHPKWSALRPFHKKA